MSKVIDAEVKEVELVEVNELIKVKQVPQVEFTKLKQYNAQLIDRLGRLDLDNLVADEDNLKEIKTTRTEVRKELKQLEDSRKKTEKTILAPYKEFEKEYKKLIKKPLQSADKDLKAKVDEVEDDLRKQKTQQFKDKFEELKKEHDIDFVKFEDANLNIQLSTSIKSLDNDLDKFFEKVKNDLAVINTNTNKERVLVKYMQDLDLSNAIVSVENAIKQEEELKARKEAEEKTKEEVEKPLDITEPVEEIVEVPKEEEVMTLTFTVTGTKQQLIAVREFMRGNNITYE